MFLLDGIVGISFFCLLRKLCFTKFEPDILQWNSIRDELTSATLLSLSLSYLSQDQLIVFFTVVTMAIMISALLACRLRTRNMLDECMHPDLDDDDLDLDTNSFSLVQQEV